MSKKVLKIAGRRPMLLALIVMATITLGLLFSGWLTPAHVKAQNGNGNGGSNGENTGCPNYTYTTNVSCPQITNAMSLTPMSFCVKLGDGLPDPGWTAPGPGATPGSVVVTTTETCSGVVTNSTNNITYSFRWFYDQPGKPTVSIPGTYTSPIIWGITSSSDTNDCPSPALVNLGQVTWHVIDPKVYATNVDFDLSELSSEVSTAEAAAEVIGGSCTNSFPKNFKLTVNNEFNDICCADGSVGTHFKKTGSVSITGFHQECDSPGVPWCGFKFHMTESVDVSGSVSLSNEYDICPNDPPNGHWCITLGAVNLTLAGGVYATLLNIPKQYFNVSGIISGTGGINAQRCYFDADGSYDGPPDSYIKLCVKSVDVTGSITTILGLSVSISGQLYAGTCN